MLKESPSPNPLDILEKYRSKNGCYKNDYYSANNNLVIDLFC